ncbi:MAG: hypothetical protein PHV51_05205 [Methanosarcinaceae archaeon]|nr:hypothetical protein [Methanosarcinaceae archaeon]MDD4497533.1 hypothetical protein [Methanosarcinaceae archaeon]
MNYRYDLQNNILFNGECELPAYSLEINEIGTCSICDSSLLSLSYHISEEHIFITTKCISCGAFYVNSYGSDWAWLDEAPLSLVPISISLSNPTINDLNGLKTISINKLNAIFSPGEIEALFSRARAETPIRQYLYRARKKYDLFEELFEIRLEF